jgi:hypothetical protein
MKMRYSTDTDGYETDKTVMIPFNFYHKDKVTPAGI